jgi:hypothetical protein
MKKIIMSFITMSLLFGLSLQTSNAEGSLDLHKTKNVFMQSSTNITKFSDVKSDFWAYTAIQNLLDKKIIEAKVGDQYKPNEFITRYDAAKYLVNALKLNLNNPDYKDVDFKDVSKQSAMYPYVKAVFNENIFVGGNSGKFGGNDLLTRGQMAKVLVETFDLEGDYPTDFKDVKRDHWAYSYVDKLAASEVTVGYKDMSFKAENSVTRAQMAAFIYRSQQGSPFKDYLNIDRMSLNKFTMKNGVFYFDVMNPVLPKTTINPDINRQIYNLALSLVDPDLFVGVDYIKGMEYGSRASVSLNFNPAFYNVSHNFNFMYSFYDTKYQNEKIQYKTHSDKQKIQLSLQTLYNDYDKQTIGEYAEPKIKQKLKDSLVVQFGSEGNGMFEFIFSKYIQCQKDWIKHASSNDRSTLEVNYGVKKFNTVQVDVSAYQGTLSVGFSFN